MSTHGIEPHVLAVDAYLPCVRHGVLHVVHARRATRKYARGCGRSRQHNHDAQADTYARLVPVVGGGGSLPQRGGSSPGYAARRHLWFPLLPEGDDGKAAGFAPTARVLLLQLRYADIGRAGVQGPQDGVYARFGRRCKVGYVCQRLHRRPDNGVLVCYCLFSSSRRTPWVWN